jgi:penicillin-binding protein 1A
MTETKQPAKKRPLLKRILRYTLYFFVGIVVYIVAVDMNLFYLFGYTPGISELKNPEVAVASEVYFADGKILGRYYKENRTPVDFDSISPLLVNALIATEDIRFYKHNGIDFHSVFSSGWSTATGDTRGASTITQQLVKNLYNTRKKKSQGLLGHIPGVRAFVYKTKEWIAAVKIELYYSKNDILALYLNTVEFGNNTYGVKVASRTYFDKPPSKLNLQEAALLVGMLKATTTYNPLVNPEKAVERRNIVLSQMQKYEMISKKEEDSTGRLPLGLNLTPEQETDEKDSYIRLAVASSLKNWCRDNNYDIYSDGLKIYTSIDPLLQTYAEQAMQQHMRGLQKKFYAHWGKNKPWTDAKGKEIPGFLDKLLKKTPAYKALSQRYGDTDSLNIALNRRRKMRVFTWNGDRDTMFSTMDSLGYYASILQTGMMVVHPESAQIKVWIGGPDHRYFKYDHVNQSRRQPGSTFKPFAYLAAIDNGYNPCDRFVDRPVSIRYVEKGEQKVWSPQNADWVFTGYNMTLRWAMGRSCNSVTAQLTEKIGWDKVVEYAKKTGISSPLESVPSICLGSSDVNVYEMVRAYSTFMNFGVKKEPMLVTRITDRDGNILAEFRPEEERVLDEETAFLMQYMFRGGMEEPGGTSQALWEYDIFGKHNEIGGKTGTSSDYSDGWFMGLTKDLVAGIWVGADDRSIHFRNSQMGEGSRTALPIFGRFMEKVYKDPLTGITQGKFPKARTKISKPYICPNVRPRETDSTAADSMQLTSPMPADTTM